MYIADIPLTEPASHWFIPKLGELEWMPCLYLVERPNHPAALFVANSLVARCRELALDATSSFGALLRAQDRTGDT